MLFEINITSEEHSLLRAELPQKGVSLLSVLFTKHAKQQSAPKRNRERKGEQKNQGALGEIKFPLIPTLSVNTPRARFREHRGSSAGERCCTARGCPMAPSKKGSPCSPPCSPAAPRPCPAPRGRARPHLRAPQRGRPPARTHGGGSAGTGRAGPGPAAPLQPRAAPPPPPAMSAAAPGDDVRPRAAPARDRPAGRGGAGARRPRPGPSCVGAGGAAPGGALAWAAGHRHRGL